MRLIERLHAILATEPTGKPARPAQIATRRPSGPIGEGFVDPRQREGTRRIALTLDQPTFDRVRDVASKKNISFAAAARELIEAGANRKGVSPCQPS